MITSKLKGFDSIGALSQGEFLSLQNNIKPSILLDVSDTCVQSLPNIEFSSELKRLDYPFVNLRDYFNMDSILFFISESKKDEALVAIINVNKDSQDEIRSMIGRLLGYPSVAREDFLKYVDKKKDSYWCFLNYAGIHVGVSFEYVLKCYDEFEQMYGDRVDESKGNLKILVNNDDFFAKEEKSRD